MKEVIFRACRVAALIFYFGLVSCASKIDATTASAYQGKLTPVSLLGVCGTGAKDAIPAFTAAGYNVKEITAGKAKSVPFLAAVDCSPGSCSTIRVIKTDTAETVWSGQGDCCGCSGGAKKLGMGDLVAKFAKSFPPTAQVVAPKPKVDLLQ